MLDPVDRSTIPPVHRAWPAVEPSSPVNDEVNPGDPSRQPAVPKRKVTDRNRQPPIAPYQSHAFRDPPGSTAVCHSMEEGDDRPARRMVESHCPGGECPARGAWATPVPSVPPRGGPWEGASG